jgi:hypothetical protein
VIRNNLYSLFEQFDYPDPTTPTGHRNATTVAPQSLLMMNSELMMDSADAFAKKICSYSHDPNSRVQFAYQSAFGREPTQAEVRRAIDFIDEMSRSIAIQKSSSDAAWLRPWSLWCQSLLASNEFIFLR